MFGKAVIIFSQTQHDSTLISGSARSIDNIHIKTILDNIAVKEPQLIIKYGGHKGAAGLTIKKSDFDKFYQLFESEITDIITKQNIILEPIIEYDFELDEHHFELETLDKIDALEPFGREFEKPLFCNQFMLENLRLVGKDKNHAQLVLRYKNISSIKAIWFNATDNKILEQLIIGDCIKACYELQKEEFLGQINLSLNIKTIEK